MDKDSVSNSASVHKTKALELLDKIYKIGYPNVDNIYEIESIILELQKLAHHFLTSDEVAVSQIHKLVNKIKQLLENEGDMPLKLYTQLNHKLIVLKTSILNHYKG